jgi:predicted outer membrane protein
MATNILAQKLNSFGVSLHSAILGQLIGEIDGAIEDGRIRSQDGKLSVYDFFSAILKPSNPSRDCNRLVAAVPAVVPIWYDWKFPGERQKTTKTTDLAGLIYIAYLGGGDFSCQIRAASSALLAAEFSKNPSPIAHLERSFAKSEEVRAELNEALDKFPITLDRLHRTSGIVSKSQVQRALKASFIRGRDWMIADGQITMNESTFNILILSFRSAAGTDLADLPRLISVETERYFQFQRDRRINSRVGKREVCDGQLDLLDDLS